MDATLVARGRSRFQSDFRAVRLSDFRRIDTGVKIFTLSIYRPFSARNLELSAEPGLQDVSQFGVGYKGTAQLPFAILCRCAVIQGQFIPRRPGHSIYGVS